MAPAAGENTRAPESGRPDRPIAGRDRLAFPRSIAKRGRCPLGMRSSRRKYSSTYARVRPGVSGAAAGTTGVSRIGAGLANYKSENALGSRLMIETRS